MDDKLEVGCRVKNIYSGEVGTVLKVWDGKYFCDYYEGEQYNPHRITVKYDNPRYGPGVCHNGTFNAMPEELEVIHG